MGGDRHAIVVDPDLPPTRPGTRVEGLVRRLRRDLGPEAATRCAPTAGPPPTRPGCRSSPGCCAGTRCKAGRRPRDPVHDRRHEPRTTCGRLATTPARRQPGVPADGRPVPARGVDFAARLPRRHPGRPQAMKTYGLVLADNGSPVVLPGGAACEVAERLIDELKTSRPRRSWPSTPPPLKVSGDSSRRCGDQPIQNDRPRCGRVPQPAVRHSGCGAAW